MAPALGKSYHGPQGRAKNRSCELAKDPELGSVLDQMEPTTCNPAMLVARENDRKRGHALGVQGRMFQMTKCFMNVLFPTVT